MKQLLLCGNLEPRSALQAGEIDFRRAWPWKHDFYLIKDKKTMQLLK